MPTHELNGVSIAYEDSGGSGPAFVLVHGFTGNRHDFRDHYEALCKIGRTIIYDHRGHGDSTNTGDGSSYNLMQLVADLVAFLDALSVDVCDLLGHSMGGMVALRFVLQHPSRVRSLILMDTAARVPDRFVRSVFSAGGEVARTEGMAKLAEVARALAADDPNRPQASLAYEQHIGSAAYWERHRNRMSAMDPEAFAELGAAMCDQEPLTDRLGEIRCPTTILVGNQDAPFIAPARELQAGINNSTLVVIPEAAHSPQLENPEGWFEAVEDHLRDVRR